MPYIIENNLLSLTLKQSKKKNFFCQKSVYFYLKYYILSFKFIKKKKKPQKKFEK